eukprot:2330826-Heterocapsa_arctica.AAC.1
MQEENISRREAPGSDVVQASVQPSAAPPPHFAGRREGMKMTWIDQKMQEYRDFQRGTHATLGCKVCPEGQRSNIFSKVCWARQAGWLWHWLYDKVLDDELRVVKRRVATPPADDEEEKKRRRREKMVFLRLELEESFTPIDDMQVEERLKRYRDEAVKESMTMEDCKLVSSPKVGGAYSQEQRTTPLTSEDASRY